MGAAVANFELGLLTEQQADAILEACKEILEGKHHEQFPEDMIQGGAGTTTNMNANEVIANRAIEILGGTKGDYSIVHHGKNTASGCRSNETRTKFWSICTCFKKGY